MPSGERWEREVAAYLRSRGYHAEVRSNQRGHEIDVFATRGADTLVVECKDWNQAVSKDPVRTVHNNANDLGATPVIAYTSELTDGARRLAEEEYDVVPLPADIVRGDADTIEDVRRAGNRGTTCLPNEPPVERLEDPIGPFSTGNSLVDQILTRLRNDQFLPVDEQAIKQCVRTAVESHRAPICVPILRQTRDYLDLYFITPSEHDILPSRVEKVSVEFL